MTIYEGDDVWMEGGFGMDVKETIVLSDYNTKVGL